MNKWIMVACIIALCILTLGLNIAIADTVVQANCSVSLPVYGITREGLFTGEIQSNVPNGFGTFSAVNSENVKWIYVGYFTAGVMSGEGYTSWETGGNESGTYKDGYLVSGTKVLSSGSKAIGTYAYQAGIELGILDLYNSKGYKYYSGETENGTPKGNGKLFDVDGNIIFDGTIADFEALYHYALAVF